MSVLNVCFVEDMLPPSALYVTVYVLGVQTALLVSCVEDAAGIVVFDPAVYVFPSNNQPANVYPALEKPDADGNGR